MTCEDARRILHLDRPGERSEMDERSLEDHLRSCASCRQKLERIRATSDTMDRMVRIPHSSVHVANETRLIMDAIRQEQRPAVNVIDVVLSFASQRAVRYAYGLAACLILFLMGSELLPRTADDPVSGSRTGPYVAYRVDASELAELRDLPLPSALTGGLQSDGSLELSQQDVQRSSGILGQAMLRSLSLSDDERRFAELMLSSLTQAAEPTIRFGKIGG